MRTRVSRLVILVALLVALVPLVVLAYDWPVFNYDQQHSGNNSQETIISAGNVNLLKKQFQVSLSAGVDGAPLYLSQASTISGTRDLLLLTSSAGHLVTLDAHTGLQIWSKQYGPGVCIINNNTGRNETCYTTSSPALDPNHTYVYSYGLDGLVHKNKVFDGTEIMTGGWPELATTKPFDEKGSSALSIATVAATSYLYVANGGYPGDAGDYQGHLTAINLSDGSQHVFNAQCSNQPVHFKERPATPDCNQGQTAIWARVGTVYDPDTQKIYMSTGNGTFTPGSFGWGDTVFALHPDGTGTAAGNPLDSFTPSNYALLQSQDADIGSTAPAILPTSNYTNTNIVYPHIALQSGKEYRDSNSVNHTPIFLLNLDNLSNSNPVGTGHTGGSIGAPIDLAQGNVVLTAPAVWVNGHTTWAFIANDNGISAYKLVIDGSGNPTLSVAWNKNSGTYAGTSPIVANGVLYLVEPNPNSASKTTIRALDPLTGNPLWNDSTNVGLVHWSSPIVANGLLYIADGGHTNSGHLTAYSINGVDPTPTPPLLTPTPIAPGPPPVGYTYPVAFVANAANGFTTFLSLQNTSSSPASISIQYYTSNGSLLSTDADTSLNSYSLWNPVTKLTLGQSGTAIVSSNQPLNIVVAEATPYGGSAYVLPGAVGASLVSPLALNGAYGFTTQLNVFNAGTTSSNVTVQFYSSDGNHIGIADQIFNLPTHSSKNIDETAIGLPAGFNGWAAIGGDTGANLTAQTLEQNPTTRFVAIIGSATPTNQLFAPAIFNGAFGNFVTGSNLVNPNASPVTVNLTYHDAAGNAITIAAFTIPAHGSQPIYHADTSGNGLPSGGLPAHFAGTASITANGNLLLVVNEDGGTTATGSRESGVYLAPGAGKSQLGLPVMSNGYIGFYTGASILNTSSSPITIAIQYYDTNGNAIGSPRPQLIAPFGTYFIYQGAENPVLPANFYGSAIVRVSGASNSIVAITNASSGEFFYSYAGQ